MRRSLLLLSAVTLIAAVPLLASAQGAKPALYTADQASAGAAVYAQACGACHGAQLEGVAAPAATGCNVLSGTSAEAVASSCGGRDGEGNTDTLSAAGAFSPTTDTTSNPTKATPTQMSKTISP